MSPFVAREGFYTWRYRTSSTVGEDLEFPTYKVDCGSGARVACENPEHKNTRGTIHRTLNPSWSGRKSE